MAGAFKLEYGYDVGGRLTSVTNPWGITVGYPRDRAGRVTHVTNGGYPGFGNYTDDIRYRAFGGVKAKALGNGLNFTASYDNRLRVTGWSVPLAGGGGMGSEYAYDNFGENTGRVTYAKNLYDGSLDRSYRYDHVGRLVHSLTGREARQQALGETTQGIDGDYGQAYHYDARGNLTQRDGWGGAGALGGATYDARNQRAGQQYDAAGNMTSDGYTSFAYDATGSEASASSGVSHTYDGDLMRVKRVENGVTTLYLRSSVLGGAIIAEMNAQGSWTRGYVYGESGNLTAIQQPEGYVEWVTQDPVTKGQRITNSQGKVTAALEFDPFGGETSKSYNSYRQPQKYTTYTRDSNGTDDAMHRRYIAYWSRFQQPDPYDGSYDLSDLQSFNRYAYVQNDPVNFTDPSGLLGMEVPMLHGSPTFDWGGGGGGMYAFWGSRIADLPGFGTNWGSFAALAEMGYEERLNNARSGYGFISNEQVQRNLSETYGEGIHVVVNVRYDGTLEGAIGALNRLAGYGRGWSIGRDNTPYRRLQSPGIQTMDGEIIGGIITGAGAGAIMRRVAGAVGGAIGALLGRSGGASRVVVNIGGEGEVAGALNVQGRWIFDAAWRSSRSGQTLQQLQSQGHRFVIGDNTRLPFASGSVDRVITNSVPINTNTWLGPGVQSSEVWRILRPGGTWINNGSAVSR